MPKHMHLNHLPQDPIHQRRPSLTENTLPVFPRLRRCNVPNIFHQLGALVGYLGQIHRCTVCFGLGGLGEVLFGPAPGGGFEVSVALFEFAVSAGEEGVRGEVGFEVCGCFGGVGEGEG